MTESSLKLGDRLRATRTRLGLSLREVERRSGVNSGYLSQLERNEVTNPGPSVLQKVAKAYEEPFPVLMRWAGYIEDDPSGLSPNARRALSTLGDDFSDDELAALQAVLKVMRSNSTATFTPVHRTDLCLGLDDRALIRKHAVALLREVDGLRPGPADLSAAMSYASLVQSGEIELTLEEKRGLRARFGNLVDRVLSKLQGVIHFDSGAVYLNPDLHEMKRRFVLSHEIGHAVLPEHRLTFAFLDDHQRLQPEFNDLLERQANHFAVELLAKGDRLREEFDSSNPSRALLTELSAHYGMSLQALARRVAEESHRHVAVAIAHKGRNEGRLMPPRVYCSPAFEERLGWLAGRRPAQDIANAVHWTSHDAGLSLTPLKLEDRHGRDTEVQAQGVNTPYAAIVLFWIKHRGLRLPGKSFRL